jgi:hypothetical protein
LTGDVIYPLLIDPKYTVDIDTLPDWAKYEALVYSGLEMVSPGKPRRAMPEMIKMIICDFDGVVTDNLVITDQDGKESVTASRSDSMHIKTFLGAESCCDGACEKDGGRGNAWDWVTGQRACDARSSRAENGQS